MELTLNTSTVSCYEKALHTQTVRKEETQDSVVPDTLPDIGEIVSTSGNVLIRSKDVGEGRIRLEANVPARVAYATEEGDGLYCLEVNVPLYVSLEDPSIPDHSLCVTDLTLSALETKMLNPRKVSVRAEAVFRVDCYAAVTKAFAGAPAQPEEGINVLEREVALTPVCAVTEKTFVLTDEFAVPAAMPPAAELLCQNTLLQVEEIKTVGTKLVVKGSAESALLYAAEDMTVGAVEFSTGFSQIIEAETLPEDPFVSVRLLLSGAFYDLSGDDGRGGSMELHVVAQAAVCGRAEATCLADVYSNRYRLNTASERAEIRRIRKAVTLRETLREQFPTASPVSEILQGCYTLGTALAGENGDASLPVTVCAHYRTADGRLCTAKRTFQLKFPAAMGEGETLEVCGASAQRLELSSSAGGIEVRLPVELAAFIWEREPVEHITAIDYDETETQDLSALPSLVLLRASSNDDLWTLAKENASTTGAIAAANGLDNLTAPWEKLLLIPKTV